MNPVSGMRLSFRLLAGVLAVMLALGDRGHAQTVATFHGSAERSGLFIVPGLTWARARALRPDPGFAPRFAGHVYAQPLYWQPPGGASGSLFLATENDTVVAIDARSGHTIWTRALGRPVPLAAQPCGNIDPLGITGTPALDEASGTLYLDAMVGEASGAHHRIFALSLESGAVLPGWPIDVGAALSARGGHFVAADQNERGALLIQNGRVYVPFGGHFGDCGNYRGWVVGIGLKNPRDVVSWSTRARGGGIWAPGGIAGDGSSLFVATGNTFGARQWSDGEAVFRLAPNLARSERSQDFFAPSDWLTLDARDLDLGGSNPLPLTLPGKQALVLALGKDGRAYLLAAGNLGGIGGALAVATVSEGPIRTAPAAYPAADGAYVAFPGAGTACPAGHRGNGFVVLEIRAEPRPSIATAWCAALEGAGSPMVTTTDGRSEPIVWVLGADGDNRLHGLRGDTGEPLFTGPPLSGLHHFQTLLPAAGRLYVGADERVWAFSY